MTRQDRQGQRRCLDNATRSRQALLGIINDIFERSLSTAIDSLTALIGDVHVPA